ncbi:MAG: hypothetical protein ACK4K5_07445 [Thermosynechococcus sp.]|uniref:hypothetical protein n=1 Tax=Thermosynechococcus sp. TaxID=2814275 RepID=UPI00391BF127
MSRKSMKMVLGVVGFGLLSVLPFVVLPQATAETIQIAQIQPQTKKRIAVLDFEFASTGLTGLWLYGEAGPAKGVSELLTNRLAQTGRLTLVEHWSSAVESTKFSLSKTLELRDGLILQRQHKLADCWERMR